MYNEDIFANEFGLTVSEQSAIVEARVLPPPLVSLISHAFYLFKHQSCVYNLYADKHSNNINTSTLSPIIDKPIIN